MVGLGGTEQGWGGWSEVVREDTWEKLMPESRLEEGQRSVLGRSDNMGEVKG